MNISHIYQRNLKIVILPFIILRVKLSKFLLFCLSIIIITSLLSVSLTGQQTTVAQTNSKFVTYDNPTFGVRIQYPSDWGRLDLSFLQQSADIDFYPLADTSLAKNVKIQVNNLPSRNMTLEEYTNSQINPLEERLLESNTTTLAGIPGYEIVFTSLQGLKTMQVWTIKNDKAYIITYVAQEEDYEKELQVAQKMIDSFEITK
jgi:eukaryotic-like serine/threonine-protein kinase